MIEEQVYQQLGALAIDYELVMHREIYTAAEVDFYTPGSQVKNLLLKGRSKRFYLVILLDYKRVNLKLLAEKLQEKRLSFASEKDLLRLLEVGKGAVTPLTVFRDQNQEVIVILDEEIDPQQPIGFHPGINTATLVLAFPDFLKFLKHFNHSPVFLKVSDD